MSGSMVVLLFLVLLTTGLPIAVSMGIPSALYLIVANIPPSQLIQRMVTSLNSFPMLAVPLFILAAGLMNSSGITERLFEFAKLLVGRLKGGLAQVNIVASLIFSGISGAALADVGDWEYRAGGNGETEVPENACCCHYSRLCSHRSDLSSFDSPDHLCGCR